MTVLRSALPLALLAAALPSPAAITFVTEAVWKAAHPDYTTLTFQDLAPGTMIGYSRYAPYLYMGEFDADAGPEYADGHGARSHSGYGNMLGLSGVTAFAGIVPAGGYSVTAYTSFASGGSVTQSVSGPFYVLSDQPLISIYAQSDGISATGDYDDILYYAPVPEPAPLATLGLGALSLLRRRRRAR